ncbi:MAG: hypothetical protein HYX68_24310 [Planctomycetes bacterium]|nr:hypothetical protein [Planctomycetota bacterium]
MFFRSVGVALGLMGFCLASPAMAGYYSSFDTARELAWSRDFGNVFKPILDDLIIIRERNAKRSPPIRKRYILIETLAQAGGLKFQDIEDKLDYSTVLIRRGKPDEAVQFLLPLEGAMPENFLVQAHCASARFLGSPDFKREAASCMRQSLKHWPKTWEELKDADRVFVETKLGWEKTAFERFRRYETYFSRLITHRMNEQRRLSRKEVVPDTLDPIFTDPKEKPLTFKNAAGEFEPGKITAAEKDKLPRDAIQAVEQLLIWMPTDDRLMWLLAEAFNASAMFEPDAKTKNELLRNSLAIFKGLYDQDFNKQKIYARAIVQAHYKKLAEHVATLPQPLEITPRELGIKDGDDAKPPVGLPNEDWWRALAVGMAAGIAVGIFALWQVQEFRRRTTRV